jgi:hypothetical protein
MCQNVGAKHARDSYQAAHALSSGLDHVPAHSSQHHGPIIIRFHCFWVNIMLESTVSFLGLGVKPTPNWGMN